MATTPAAMSASPSRNRTRWVRWAQSRLSPSSSTASPARSLRTPRMAAASGYMTCRPAVARACSMARDGQLSATTTLAGTGRIASGTAVATSHPPRWVPARITPRPRPAASWACSIPS